MTPIKWVQKYDLRDGPQPIETGPVTFIPVLTLDQLEAWVKEKLATLHSDPSKQRRLYGHGRCIYSDIFDDLLAQVQEWRTQGDTR
jgi:hypothetical protein